MSEGVVRATVGGDVPLDPGHTLGVAASGEVIPGLDGLGEEALLLGEVLLWRGSQVPICQAHECPDAEGPRISPRASRLGPSAVWSASQLRETVLSADLAPVALNREVSNLAAQAPEEGRDI